MTHDETCLCFGCKARSVGFAPSATGSVTARDVNDREKRWDRDHDAYRRLRKNGVQPPHVDGAGNLENAGSTFEIATGHLFPTPEARRQVQEGIRRAEEMNLKAPGS